MKVNIEFASDSDSVAVIPSVLGNRFAGFVKGQILYVRSNICVEGESFFNIISKNFVNKCECFVVRTDQETVEIKSEFANVYIYKEVTRTKVRIAGKHNEVEF